MNNNRKKFLVIAGLGNDLKEVTHCACTGRQDGIFLDNSKFIKPYRLIWGCI